MRDKICLNDDWKFHLGDIVSIRNRWAWGKSGSWMQGPESMEFDDGDWENVKLPHDFVIRTRPYALMDKEFGADNPIPAMEDVNNIHTTAGSFDRQVGLYRKYFYVPDSYEGKKVYLVFDGVYRESMMILNHFLIGGERSGYSQIRIDITDFVLYGQENVLYVRADAGASEGWFYEAGGIYRSVWMEICGRQHMDNVFIHAELEKENKVARISVSLDVADDAKNAGVWELVCNVEDVCKTFEVTPGKNAVELSVTNPKLWSPEKPELYEVKLELRVGGQVVDVITQRIGIRSVMFSAKEGFLLNGRQVKIKGVCCHQNHGGIGCAVPDEVFRYRIRNLKEMGANAYRVSHYPAAESLLRICDEEGMLVMNENRLFSSEEGDLFQLRRMVKLSRNHPSVILYSIGNEEAQSQVAPQAPRIAKTMVNCIKELDPYTPITMALLMFDLRNRRPIESHKVFEGIFDSLDVVGFNYWDSKWEEFHREYPDKPFICTEQGTFKSTRGCYKTDKEKCHLAITDKTADSYMKGAAMWQAALPQWVSGLFIWTGFDYYGEPTPFAWPAISSQFGVMDICGFPKDFYYYYKAWWTKEPVVHVFPDMYETPGTIVDYHVFGNAGEVELIRNGESLGRKVMPQNGYLVWEGIEARAGEMLVRGYNNGDLICEEVQRSGGIHTTLKVEQEYRENDIVVYRLSVRDENGNIVPNRDLEYEVPQEMGEILGMANGNPTYHADVRSRRIETFHGLAQVIVRIPS